ncbi:hypothetical protein ACP4OV_000948 [Aristida adscensionis]
MAVISEFEEGDEGEAAAAAKEKAVGGSDDEDVLAGVLERKGGPLPFLEAAIDVARKRSGLFRDDPTVVKRVAAMASAARDQAEAEERLARAKEAARKAAAWLRNARSTEKGEGSLTGEYHGILDYGIAVSSEPNAGNGLDLEKYSWTQEPSEVNITVPLPQGTNSRSVVCEIERNHLKVALKGQTPIIDGELYQPIKVVECFWSIEDGKSLTILLTKQNQKEWWASVIRGSPELDIQKKLIPSEYCDLDFDHEGRQNLQKALFDHHQRMMGLPTSADIQKEEILKKSTKKDI